MRLPVSDNIWVHKPNKQNGTTVTCWMPSCTVTNKSIDEDGGAVMVECDDAIEGGVSNYDKHPSTSCYVRVVYNPLYKMCDHLHVL